MEKVHRYYYWIILVPFIIALGWGCSTTKEVSVKEDTTVKEDSVSYNEMSDEQKFLTLTRSNLSDSYMEQTHDMPEVFMKKKSGGKTINSNPFDGYRVQILSTRNVENADSLANDFHVWADTTISGYSADSYVLYNQPYYKVHIGDFQQRSQANSFSQLIKTKYPDAWVVHDRIEPGKVPADTTSFSFIEKNEDENEYNKDKEDEDKPKELEEDKNKDRTIL